MQFVVIQARATSTRLPKKVLKQLCDRTVLETIFERLKDFKEDIIVATTDDGSQKEIVDICKKHSIRYFEGSCENVLDRFYNALVEYGAYSGDTVVRITSDCPLIDGEIVKRCIDMYEDGGYDYLSNIEKRTFPRGLDVEVMSFDVLEDAYNEATTPNEKEHVTPYIRITNREQYKIGSYKDSEDNSRFRLTLDEERDLKSIRELMKILGCRYDFGYELLIKVLKEHPEISKINAQVKQKH